MLGAFPSQIIEKFIHKGFIKNSESRHIQPSSLDLTISDEVYEVSGVFLPQKHESIRGLISFVHGKKVSLDSPLECHKVYLCKLQESLDLPDGIYAYANNKSSTGRINLQIRLLCDGNPTFDQVPRGYKGELWILASPHSFAVKLSPGEPLNQLRIYNADSTLSQEEHMALYNYHPLLYDAHGNTLPLESVGLDKGGGVTMTVDFDQDIVGYVAFPQPGKVLHFGKYDHKVEDFFQPIFRPDHDQLVLSRDGFYIFSTKEYISIPPEFAVEMIAYDPSKGEFRSHYAGFFDPGWGYGEKGERQGTPAVLEVYPHDHNFIFRDGQPICKMVYERLATFPDRIYGTGKLGSHYGNQRGPRVSKHFTVAA